MPKKPLKIDIKFKCEVFQRIVPPCGGAAPLQDPDASPGCDFGGTSGELFGKPTVLVAGGRFYWNGEIRQVITEEKDKITHPNGHGVEFTPRPAIPAGENKTESVPRFDGSQDNLFIILQRSDKETKTSTHRAVLLIDMPSQRSLLSGDAFLGEKVNQNDTVSTTTSFETYFLEDCEGTGSAGLITHKVAWGWDLSFKVGTKEIPTKGLVKIAPSAVILVEGDSAIDKSSLEKAAKNEPPPEKVKGAKSLSEAERGWRPSAGSVSKTEF